MPVASHYSLKFTRNNDPTYAQCTDILFVYNFQLIIHSSSLPFRVRNVTINFSIAIYMIRAQPCPRDVLLRINRMFGITQEVVMTWTFGPWRQRTLHPLGELYWTRPEDKAKDIPYSINHFTRNTFLSF